MYMELMATVPMAISSFMPDEVQVTDEGFSYEPDMVRSINGTLWLTWKTYDPENNDTSIFVSSYMDGRMSDSIKIASSKRDILSPKLAVDGDETLWVIWTENRDGRKDVYARYLENGAVSDEIPVTDDGESFNPVVEANNGLWVAWQSKVDGNFKIYARRYSDGKWQEKACISENRSSNRKPDIVVDSKGRAWIAWDSFKNGNYDIYLSHSTENKGWSEPIRVTASMRYDMDPSITVDEEDGVWITWVRSPVWGQEHYRLNVGKRLMTRKYMPESDNFSQPQVERRDLDGMVLIPVDARERVVPITPEVITGKNGVVHVFFRQFRDQGGNDWGWDTALISYSGSKWSDVQIISAEPGYPISRIGAAQDDSGCLWAVYQSCGNPGGRKPLSDNSSNVYLRQIIPEDSEEPVLTASVMPEQKHLEEFDVPRPDPDKYDTIRVNRQSYKLLWGDMHRHSDLSKCVPERDGSLWDHYRWAQDVAQLDFYSTTDHTEQTSDYEARKGMIWADLFYSEPDFAAILGCEQNFRDTEHTNFFYIDRSIGQLVRGIRQLNINLTDAIKMLDEAEAKGKVLIARHFHGDGFGKKYETAPPINSDYEWVIEAVQTRGFSPLTVAHYLSTRAKVGLIGSSDHSRYPGGHGGPWMYPYAITGLWATNTSRESIFEALKNRRCYATNGKKMLVDFRSDGHLIGEIYETDELPVLEIRAAGTTKLVKLELIRDGQTIMSKELSDRAVKIEYKDEKVLKGEHYYYIEVTQEREWNDNYSGVAISSPVWVISN